MKKLISVLAVVLSAALVFVGCSSKTSTNNGSSSSSTDSKSEYKIGVVTDEGGAKDKSFNQSNVETVEAWVKANGGKALQPIETKDKAQIAPNLQTASKVSDIISIAGFYFQETLPKVADEYKDKKYILIDAEVTNSNVVSVLFKEQEAGYLAGYAAALQSKSGKVGFIGGAKIPAVVKFGLGFVQGAKAANKDIKIMYQYSGVFNDTNKGKTLASTMYDAGADIIFVAAGGTGSGVIKEAQERAEKDGAINHWVVGVDKDQYEEGKLKDGKSVILTSAIKRIDVAVTKILDEIKANKFEGGKTHLFSIKEDGVGLPENNPNLSADTVTKVKSIIEDLKSGKVVAVDDASKITDKSNIDGEL